MQARPVVDECLPELRLHLHRHRLGPDDILTRATHIHREALHRSAHLRGANFDAIAPEDLGRLFELYDGHFFEGRLARALAGPGGGPLWFRLSERMTRAGGRTTVYRRRTREGEHRTFEIAVSTPLLFQTFHDVRRPVTVVGLECRDRLEALQRVFEHELVHLCEFLAFGESSCGRPRFHDLARRFFGHRAWTHELVTQRERALVKHGLRVGDAVEFTHEGRRYTGFVNRITKRATVLVESPDGVRYSDGRRYRKFYVPLASLSTLDEEQS